MRLNILLGIIVVLLGYVTCKTFKKEADPVMSAPIGANGVAGEPASTYGVAKVLGSNPDTAPTVQVRQVPELVQVPIGALPPPSTSRRAYLATGWWHCNMAISGIDSLIHLNYTDKWLKFREDQSFDILIKGKVVDTGRWTWLEDKNELYLSCKDPYINNSWSLIDKGFVMIWRGNTALNLTGIQVRVACSKTQPAW
ncbi:MAG: hypothetical protein ACK5SQ_00830 [Chitinophagales bacterium]|jgi:hypothetical protein